jgi:sugar O-acyltransferase (sialic acid O-acetyltransferase NeuD family)
MTGPRIVLYGASGHAHAVRCYLEQAGLAEVVAFIDDFRGEEGLRLRDTPIISFEAWHDRLPDHPCVVAIGDPAAKRQLAEKIAGAGGRSCCLHDAPGHRFHEVAIGPGSYVQTPVYIGPNSHVGEHVAIMAMTTIGHDVEIGDYCTICPSCSIGGQVVVEAEVFLGAGSIIINGRPEQPIVIGRGATVAAGAVVTKTVPPGVTVMGNPARPLRELAVERAKQAKRTIGSGPEQTRSRE